MPYTDRDTDNIIRDIHSKVCMLVERSEQAKEKLNEHGKRIHALERSIGWVKGALVVALSALGITKLLGGK